MGHGAKNHGFALRRRFQRGLLASQWGAIGLVCLYWCGPVHWLITQSVLKYLLLSWLLDWPALDIPASQPPSALHCRREKVVFRIDPCMGLWYLVLWWSNGQDDRLLSLRTWVRAWQSDSDVFFFHVFYVPFFFLKVFLLCLCIVFANSRQESPSVLLFYKNILRTRQPCVRRISVQYSPLQAALVVLVKYTMWVSLLTGGVLLFCLLFCFLML